jgi:hypothetical protein
MLAKDITPGLTEVDALLKARAAGIQSLHFAHHRPGDWHEAHDSGDNV